MNIQEQEDRDYLPQSDLQNAYSQSCHDFTDDSGIINKKLAAGRFVVYVEGTAYCHRTDAIMGVRKVFIGDFATLTEAQAEAKQHEFYEDTDLRVVAPTHNESPTENKDLPF